jgi:hypothetical protein
MGARCPVKRYRYQVPGLKHPEVTSDFNLQISDFRFQISHCLTTDDRKMGARYPEKPEIFDFIVFRGSTIP